MKQGGASRPRGGLTRKYAVFVGVTICLALGLNTAIATFFAFSDQRALVVRVQQEQAQAAAQRIGAFVAEIMQHLDWISQSGASNNLPGERRLDGLRLLRQVPAILELRQIDPAGREQLSLSRVSRDQTDGDINWSTDPGFQAALAQGSFHSDVQFRRGSEPYMLLLKRAAAVPHWVAQATVNLVFIRDLVSRLKVGATGRAYIVTGSGRLIAHPDLRFVLRNTSLAGLVSAHEAAGETGAGLSTTDIEGRKVLSVMSAVPDLDWNVVIDLPESEAFASIKASFLRSLVLLVLALSAAVLAGIVLSRKLVAPIKTLGDGAARIGRGELHERISISTGDELQELGEQFNLMAQRLEESRAVLEDKVIERTAALEAALELASAGQRVAEEATRAKSRFLAVVGHDIRTPLSGVLGVLELLDRGRLSQRDRRLVAMAATSGDALLDLANATLDLSRLEAGTESLDLRNFELGALLNAAAALMSPLAEQKGLVLKLRQSAPGRLDLHADPGKIHRILINLLRNAISFTEHGEIEFGADLQAGSSAESSELTLAVRDTGIGIDPAMQRHIFRDFVQVDPETGRRNGGVGLGLAICSKLTELMGGTISVVSCRGQGSTFIVRLPIVAAKAAAPSGHMATGQLQRVLVVDDDPVTREVARVMVGKAGHKVQAVASGEAALATLRNRVFDIILLDMHMGGIDGIETALAVRELPNITQPRIVALTADVAPETMRRMRAAGLTAILSKPITSAALLQVIGRGSSRNGQGPVVSLSVDQPVDAAFFQTQSRLIGRERTRQLVSLFATVSEKILKGMRVALRTDDRAELGRLAHQLASSAGAVGLGRVFAQASALERDATVADREALILAIEALDRDRSEALEALVRLEDKTAAGAARQVLRSTGTPSL
ncbi:Two-component hybrid sensor and regulator [Bosea sp. LC85]|uniref:ATP-binding protein n=1 Tax=Bosea sp. LC85 TaxID=1502851 RepID=UPI0004E3B6CD|nr:ATP-binding protein [Bosea sp. LC85]KFC74067.1 Two-component hybrid sensor and regulator [Bosea sp. LC85]